MEPPSSPILSQLRVAAKDAAEVMVEYGGPDPAELIALAEQIGARENATAECTKDAGRPGVLTIRFSRKVGASF